MSYWLEKSYSYPGPGFDIVEFGEENRRFINYTGASSSRPLTPDNAPRAARQRGPHTGSLGDMTLVDGSVVVSDRFLDLVESFEPGKHLFAPMRLYRSNGDPIDQQYYFFTARQDVDCILTDNNPEWFKQQADGKWIPRRGGFSLTHGRDVYISKPQIDGLHLWSAGPLGWNELLVSDAFYEAYAIAQLDNALLPKRKCIDVDRPWVAEEQMGPVLSTWQHFVSRNRDTEIGII